MNNIFLAKLSNDQKLLQLEPRFSLKSYVENKRNNKQLLVQRECTVCQENGYFPTGGTHLHKCNYMYAIQDCLITRCVRNMQYGHNPKLFCDVLEQFQHFVKIMKSDLHVNNVKNDNVTALKLS